MNFIKVLFILFLVCLFSCNSSTDGYIGKWKGKYLGKDEEVQFTVKEMNNCIFFEGDLNGVFVKTSEGFYASNYDDSPFVVLYDKETDKLIITLQIVSTEKVNSYFTRVKKGK